MNHLDVPGLLLNAPLRILRIVVLLLLKRKEQSDITVEVQPKGQLTLWLFVRLKNLLKDSVVADLEMEIGVDNSAALLEIDISEIFNVKADQSRQIIIYFSLGFV